MWHKNSGAFVFEVSFAIALWPEQVPVAMQEIHLYKHAAPSIVRAFQGNTHFKACKEMSSTSRISTGGCFLPENICLICRPRDLH